MLGVVPLGELLGDLEELKPHQAEALALKAGDNLPHQAAPEAVGFDHHEGPLHTQRSLTGLGAEVAQEDIGHHHDPEEDEEEVPPAKPRPSGLQDLGGEFLGFLPELEAHRGPPGRLQGQGVGTGGLGELLRHPHHDSADVVGPAPLVGQLHQAPGGLLGREVFQHLLEGPVLQNPGKPVAAKEEGVPRGELKPQKVHPGLGKGAQGVGDHVAPAVGPGLLQSKKALAHPFRHPGMVLGEKGELLPPEEVGPRVPHVGHQGVGQVQEEAGGRGAHAPVLRPLGLLVDAGVGPLKGLQEGLGGGFGLLEVAEDALHGEPGRHLPGAVPPHPVGHHEDPTPRGEEVAHGVLVFGALEAGVGPFGEGEAGHEGILSHGGLPHEEA